MPLHVSTGCHCEHVPSLYWKYNSDIAKYMYHWEKISHFEDDFVLAVGPSASECTTGWIQKRQKAKKIRARHLLAQSVNQPLASPLVACGRPPPAHVDYEMGRGLNSRKQQAIPGHGEAAAVSRGNQTSMLTTIYSTVSTVYSVILMMVSFW